MKHVDLAQAAGYYDIAATAGLAWRTLEHAGLERYSEAVYALHRMAQKQDDDTGWREFLVPARRMRNVATTVPLPFSHPELGLRAVVDRIQAALPALRIYAGQEAGAIGEEILDAGRQLVDESDAPLLEAIADTASKAMMHQNGVVLPLTEYVEIASRFARRRLPGLGVWSRHDVTGLEPLERLMVVAPLYWYRSHQHVFTSPRAPQIVILKWAWYRERPPVSTALEGSKGRAGIRLRPVPAMRSAFQIEAEDERPSVDWASVSRELSSASGVAYLEPVLARPAILAARYGVLLPEDGDRSVWLLDPYAPREHRVARVEVADLEPGHVIILRTSGGGDLIVPIADEILGEDARRLRELQRRWKSQLRSWVRERATIQRAAAQLRQLGCKRASPQNLQSWLSERSLRTGDRQDWQVLMDAVSLSGDAEMIWQAMSQLHSAHSQAGRTIGKRLREMANTSPLDELLRSGRQVFTHAGGGSMTAFRVEAFAPSTVQCAPEDLMVPGEVREEWLT